MKRSTRIAIEILGPAFIGTAVLFAWKQAEFRSTSRITLSVFLAYLAFAYAFTLIPSLAYAFLMEMWLERSAKGPLGVFGIVLLSTVLGTAAGGAILLASEAPVVWIGAIVGLILGVILCVGRGRRNET